MDNYLKALIGVPALLLFLLISELVFAKTTSHESNVILTQYVPASSSTGVGTGMNGDIVMTHSSEPAKYIALVRHQGEDLVVNISSKQLRELKKGDRLAFHIRRGFIFNSLLSAHSSRGLEAE